MPAESLWDSIEGRDHRQTNERVRPIRAFTSECPVSHSFVSSVKQELSCTTDKIMTYTCSNCGYHYDKVTATKTGHSFSTSWTSNATSHWHASTCGHNVKSGTAAHTWTYSITQNPTSTEDGIRVKTCTVCEYSAEDVIPAGTYVIGMTGPGGGYIFYDCDADNTTSDPDGADNLISSTCGWRYLEAAPTVMYLSSYSDYYSPKIGGTVTKYNLFSYGTDDQYGTTGLSGTSIALGKGKENNSAIISSLGSSSVYCQVYNSDGTLSSTTASNKYAAKLCSYITYNSCSDWFLPSRAEACKICDVLFPDPDNSPYPQGTYLTSSQCREYDEGAWYGCYVAFFPDPDYDDSEDYHYGKTNSFYVIPVRRFM